MQNELYIHTHVDETIRAKAIHTYIPISNVYVHAHVDWLPYMCAHTRLGTRMKHPDSSRLLLLETPPPWV